MHLSLTDDRLTIHLAWYECLLTVSFQAAFEIPLTHIVEVSTEVPPVRWLEMRAPGSFLPGIVKAGTYFTPDGKEFWYVTTNARHQYLSLELQQEPYRRMVLTLAENEQWAEQINRARSSLRE